jgi:hypothetical protein
MAYKIKNINYNSISNADEYIVYTVAFEVEDTKSKDQVGFTHDFYFANGTKQDVVNASVISLLSGAVSIMYNKATYYNLSITSDEVADVIGTVLAIPELTTESTVTEVPVVEEGSTTSTAIDSFDAPTSTVESTIVEETSVVEETVITEPIAETTTDTTATDTTTDTGSTDTSTDSGTTDTTSTDTTETNG